MSLKKSKILIISLTRKGSIDYAIEMCKYFRPLSPAYIFAENIRTRPPFEADYIKTYSGSLFSFILNSVLFFFKAPGILREFQSGPQKNLTIYFPVFHLWNIIWTFWARRMNIDIVNTTHDFRTHKGEKNILVEYLQRQVISKSKINVFLSDFVLDQAKKYTGLELNKSFVLPHPILENEVTHNLPYSKKPSLLFLGRGVDYKGISLLTEASKGLSISKLTVAGENVSQYEVKDQHFLFVDKYIEKNEMVELALSHEILVLPYTEATQSGVLALGAGAGIPMVISRVGGLPEQLNEKSAQWTNADVMALKTGISELINDEHKYLAVRRELKLFCNQFQQDWEVKFNQMLNLE
ncbi:MAG: glycosyltransferase family 4 protein [Saprospiraceae bacterium]|nr:glycosyltransferase [Bacteroidia bacterium]NNF22134.1 glycosyltransferase family 4 protein [Saprospiraceae bacterium]